MENVVSLRQGSYAIVLPVTPAEINSNRGRLITHLDMIDWREVARIGGARLTTVQFDSFFPDSYDPSYCNYDPRPWGLTARDYWAIIEWLRSTGQPTFFNFAHSPLSGWYAIESFNPKHTAEDGPDIPFSLSLVEYVFMRPVIISEGQDIPPPPRPPGSGSPPEGTGQTYTIVSGDCLWNIAKRFYGDGSLWTIIWDANKPMTSGNPNLIYPGEVITIPPR